RLLLLSPDSVLPPRCAPPHHHRPPTSYTRPSRGQETASVCGAAVLLRPDNSARH
ncbi:uncharacterized, partial [Tachysurus ichikawai]